jgi:hypothetical protein
VVPWGYDHRGGRDRRRDPRKGIRDMSVQPSETSGNVVIKSDRFKVEEFIQYLRNRAETSNAERASEVQDSQIVKLLNAAESGDEESIWNADEGGLISGKDIAHTPTNTSPELDIYSFGISPSSDRYEAPLEHFASIRATIVSKDPRFTMGEEIIINTGAPLILTKLRALESNDMLPTRGVIVAIQARNGDVLKLRPVSNTDRATPGTTESE